MTIILSDDDLGDLELVDENGYCVISMQLGWPEVREVGHNRALADGTVDDTQFIGARAVTVTMTLDTRVAPMQVLLDQITPYVSPRRRPVLSWSLPGSDGDRRALIVRGVDAPFVLDRPKFPALACQWIAPDGLIVSPEETCQTLTPAAGSEPGRDYQECGLIAPDRIETTVNVGRCYDRTYPPADIRGDTHVNTTGNGVAEWKAALYGPISLPTLTVHDIPIAVNVTLAVGESVVIDTRLRTVLKNGDPAQSLYAQTNYTSWTWDQIRLRAGDNEVRYSGTGVTPGAAAVICWRDTWR